jgi:hypothetical protein
MGKLAAEVMIPNFNKNLFWDVNSSEIDFTKNARFVIQRILTRGSLPDWQTLKKFYGLKFIRHEVTEIRYLDKLTLNFCSQYFNIPLKRFKCYNTSEYYQQLWNY